MDKVGHELVVDRLHLAKMLLDMGLDLFEVLGGVLGRRRKNHKDDQKLEDEFSRIRHDLLHLVLLEEKPK